jgi:polysaccharide deacetylase family protein (PEP-CTERM system associated)
VPRLPLSLDWEDWFQLCCPPYDQPEALDRYECRLPLATERALELCADLGATATWFCLGDQARRHPDLLRRIVSEGHTIALHGLTHRRAFEMDHKSWRADMHDGKALLEDLAGQPVVGYRAPEWSLRGPASDWWQDLPELGFHYDSSRVPLAIIGEPSWPRRPYRLAEGLWELPPPVLWSGPPRSPLWGWGPRVLPFSLVRRSLETLAQEDAGTPLVLHPWELDEGQPSLPGASLGHRFAHSAGLRGYGSRLRDLFAGLFLTSLETWVEAQ